jgi:excinuclease ABC subunit C
MFSLEHFPQDPGCYLFKDKNSRVIYVGKAKNLKKRINSYYKRNDLDPKTKSMLKRAKSVDFIVTDNEVESLILEI